MGEGTVFSLSVNASMGEGVPHLADRGYPIPGLDGGGLPRLWSRWGGGVYPVPGPDRGYPIPGLDGG